MFPQVSKVGDGYSIIPSESSSPSRRTFAAGLIMVSVSHVSRAEELSRSGGNSIPERELTAGVSRETKSGKAFAFPFVFIAEFLLQ